MKIAFSRIVDAAISSLSHDVLPHVQNDYARGQLFAVINMLRTFGMRAGWSPEIYVAQRALQRKAISEVAKILSGYDYAIEETQDAKSDLKDVGSLLELVEVGNQKIILLQKWVDQHGNRLETRDLQKVQLKLENLMKDLVEVEWRHVASQMLAEIAGGTQPPRNDLPRGREC